MSLQPFPFSLSQAFDPPPIIQMPYFCSLIAIIGRTIDISCLSFSFNLFHFLNSCLFLTTLCPFNSFPSLSQAIDPPPLLSSIVPARYLTTSPLQDLFSPPPAVPGCDIPRCQDFVPGGNIPGGPDAALKSSHCNSIVSLCCKFLLM